MYYSSILGKLGISAALSWAQVPISAPADLMLFPNILKKANVITATTAAPAQYSSKVIKSSKLL